MSDSVSHKIIILAAPSGAGKTSIKTKLMERMGNRLSFSISATTRKIRGNEQDGVDYFFMDEEAFRMIEANDGFVEHEMVYPGLYYGTTKAEMERIWGEGKYPLLDIDVKGALNVKKKFGKDVLAIFIDPPSLEVLRDRLKKRGTDTEDQVDMRIQKAEEELHFRSQFDHCVVNNELERATQEVMGLVNAFIG
jgi:guanylate kinase